MLKLRYADYKGVYHGFVLKEGYFYGYDDVTAEYVAASGYEHEGNIRIYRLQEGEWTPMWVTEKTATFDLIGVEERSDDTILSFPKWLKSKGYEEDAWDKCDLDEFNKMQKDYYEYRLFSGLPQFAINWLKKNSKEYERIQNM